MQAVKSDTGDYGPHSFMAPWTIRHELFTRLGYRSKETKFQPDFEMPFLTWSFCQKQKMQPSPEVTLKHKDQVLHAKEVLYFAKILHVCKDSIWYLARWRHNEDWLWVRSTKKHSKSKEFIDKELHCFSRTRDTPFFLQLLQAFQSLSGYYLVTPYLGRCTLRYVTRSQGEQTVNSVMFYAMELVYAIIYLHEHDIVLRTLNTDTVMLDQEGHIFISDFSHVVVGGTPVDKRNCETVPLFNLAPEIIKFDDYTKAMDWWSLGSVIYFLLYGREPFIENNFFKTVTSILTRHPVFTFKIYGFQLIPFCKALLAKSPDRRLGSGTSGSLEVMNHCCLTLVDWDKVASRNFVPPFVPPAELNLLHGPLVELTELKTPSGTSMADHCSGDNTAVQDLNYLPFGTETFASYSEPSPRSTVNIFRQNLIAAELSKLKASRRRQRATRASRTHVESVFKQPLPTKVGSLLDSQTNATIDVTQYFRESLKSGHLNLCDDEIYSWREIKSCPEADKAEAVLIDIPTKRVLNVTKCSCGDVLQCRLKDVNGRNVTRCCQHDIDGAAESCPHGVNPHSQCVLHIFFDRAPDGGPTDRVVYGDAFIDSRVHTGDENNSGVSHGADSETEDVGENQSRIKTVGATSRDADSTRTNIDSRVHSRVTDHRTQLNAGSSVCDSSISQVDNEKASQNNPGNSPLFHPNESVLQSGRLERMVDGVASDSDILANLDVMPHDPRVSELKTILFPELNLAASSCLYSSKSDKYTLCQPKPKETECVPNDNRLRQHKSDNETEELIGRIANPESRSSSSEAINNTCFNREFHNSADQFMPTVDSENIEVDFDSKKSSVRFNSLPSLALRQAQTVEPPHRSFLGYVTRRLEDECADKSFSRFCQKSTSVSQKVRYPVRSENYKFQSLFLNTVARQPDPDAGRHAVASPLGGEQDGTRAGQFKFATLDSLIDSKGSQSLRKASVWKRLIAQVKNSEVIHRNRSSCEYESADAAMKLSNVRNKNRFPFFRTQRPLDRMDVIRDSTMASPTFKTNIKVGSFQQRLGNSEALSEPDPSDSVRILSDCIPIQASLAANVEVDFPIDSKGAHRPCSNADCKLGFCGATHLIPSDGSTSIFKKSCEEGVGQFSLVEIMDRSLMSQTKSLFTERSNGGSFENVVPAQSLIYNTDIGLSDHHTKEQTECSNQELSNHLGVNKTHSQNFGKVICEESDTRESLYEKLEHANLREPNEYIDELECEGAKTQETVIQFENKDEERDGDYFHKSFTELKESSSQPKNSEDYSYLKGKQIQSEKEEDDRQIENKSQHDHDLCFLVVNELIEALLTEVVSQTPNIDSVNGSSANLTSDSTSFVTAETTTNGTSNSTSDVSTFFTADLTSGSKADIATNSAAEGCQSFSEINFPVVADHTGGLDEAVVCQEQSPQVHKKQGQTLESHQSTDDCMEMRLRGEIPERVSRLAVNMSSNDKETRADKVEKSPEKENKHSCEQSCGEVSRSQSEAEDINEISSSGEEHVIPANRFIVDLKEHGDEFVPDKETQLNLTNIKTDSASRIQERHFIQESILKTVSDTWKVPTACQRRNVHPNASVSVVEDTFASSRSAAIAVSHGGEEGAFTPSRRNRQMMHALDEITPYSEFDAWRRGDHRPVRLRPDYRCLSPGADIEDAVGRDRGAADDDLQVIGSLTIESLEPPVKGLIFMRKAK